MVQGSFEMHSQDEGRVIWDCHIWWDINPSLVEVALQSQPRGTTSHCMRACQKRFCWISTFLEVRLTSHDLITLYLTLLVCTGYSTAREMRACINWYTPPPLPSGHMQSTVLKANSLRILETRHFENLLCIRTAFSKLQQHFCRSKIPSH
jgi:hypothetical protein